MVCQVMIALTPAGLTLAGLPSVLAIYLNCLPVYHPSVYQIPAGLRLRPGHTMGYIPDKLLGTPSITDLKARHSLPRMDPF